MKLKPHTRHIVHSYNTCKWIVVFKSRSDGRFNERGVLTPRDNKRCFERVVLTPRDNKRRPI